MRGHSRQGQRRRVLRRARARPWLTRTSAARARSAAGCVKCGRCMIGCRYNAKNTLVKNYLYLAERRGVRVVAERKVVDVAPLGARRRLGRLPRSRPSAPGAWVTQGPPHGDGRGVVFAAGALGTNALLQGCRARGSLPRISHRLGYLVRTNSEAILAVTAGDRHVDFARARRDHGQHLSRSRHAYRDRHLRRRRRSDGLLTHAAHRSGHPAHATAEAPGRGGSQTAHAAQDAGSRELVAADADPAGDADAGQLDPPAPDREPRRPRAPADRAGPRQPEPDLHRRGQRRGRATGATRSTATPRARWSRRWRTSRRRPTSSAAP